VRQRQEPNYAPVMSAPGRLCCKSRKLEGDNSPVRRRNNPQSPIRVASLALPKSPVSFS
jgi:hypothetical protein